jgi:hypothetical protein
MDEWIVNTVQDLANRERRSFTREVEVLLEAAIGRERTGVASVEGANSKPQRVRASAGSSPALGDPVVGRGKPGVKTA